MRISTYRKFVSLTTVFIKFCLKKNKVGIIDNRYLYNCYALYAGFFKNIEYKYVSRGGIKGTKVVLVPSRIFILEYRY